MSGKRDVLGPTIGLLTFLAGVILLGMTFAYAFQLYSKPPTVVLGISGSDKPVDLNQAGDSIASVVFRSIMLLVMCAVGSSIAGRGVKLYAASVGVTISSPSKSEHDGGQKLAKNE